MTAMDSGRPALDTAPIDELLQDAVDSGAIPGAVAVLADASQVLYRFAVGSADLRNGSAMHSDQVFRIASMTKLATALLTFQLVGQGRLDLDAEVASLLPEFADLPVLTGFDEAGAPLLREQRGVATVRSLLTHTSGLGYDTWFPDLRRYLVETGLPKLGEGERRGLVTPLVSDPGTSFHYGTSMDWLGLVLEKATGDDLRSLYQERLFTPLGMRDTSVWARSDPRLMSRMAAVHVPGPGGWQGTDADYWAPSVEVPEFFPAGHGLYATADDYLKLQQVALAGGEWNGVRIAPAELVDELYVNQIGELDVGLIPTADPPASVEVDLRGWKWSLGLLLAAEERPGMRSAGSAGWAGGFNTFYWMDRERGITAALHTATLPFYEPGVISTYESFERAVNRAVDEAGS